MAKIVYPLYLQNDSISSLYAQMFELSEQTKKISRGKSETKSTEKKISLVLSLLQSLGLEGSFRRENSENVDYTEEILQVVGSEDKLRFIRTGLSEQGVLYNLNLSLKKERPFGSFIDFEGEAEFIPIPPANDDALSFKDGLLSFNNLYQMIEISQVVKVEGTVENYQFTTVCSVKYFSSRTMLMDMLMMGKNKTSDHQAKISGFGIVTGFSSEKKSLSIKPLMLALVPQDFRVK